MHLVNTPKHEQWDLGKGEKADTIRLNFATMFEALRTTVINGAPDFSARRSPIPEPVAVCYTVISLKTWAVSTILRRSY